MVKFQGRHISCPTFSKYHINGRTVEQSTDLTCIFPYTNPAVYLQVDDHVHPGNCPTAVSSEKKQDLLHMEFYHHLPSWAMSKQMLYFSSVSDEGSCDLKTTKEIPVQKYRNSVHVEEEEAKELLEVITAERLETEQQQKLEQQEQLSIEKLRLEIELSRNANQSATQNNGQTSRVKSLDEIVKMAFASEMVSDELKPKVLLCMLGDKVSNLLVNLGEEELKDYESLKQVVLKEGANDFESVNQLIVADKMFEMLDSETATHIGVLQGKNGTNPGTWANNVIYFTPPKGNPTMDLRELNGMIVKREVLMVVGKTKEVDNKRLNVNKVSTEGTELEDGTVTARVDLLGKVIPRRAIEDKLSKLVKTSISVDGKLVHALVDSGTEITVVKKDLVPEISVEGAFTIYLKGIFGPAVKCPLVYVPIGLATGGQVNVVHQQVLCALAEVLVEDVLLPPDVLDMLGGAQSEENSLAQSSQDLRVDSGKVDETEVSSGILPERKHRSTLRILKGILLHVGMKWEHWVLRMRR
ncbi:CCHC-type domain-containing protein [Trichonephila clavipes]|nr:CCHC-type domain-containing protein [Trichonephila clavipes]